MISPCGVAYHGRRRNDRDLSQYRCRNLKWRADREPCGCPPLEATAIESRVWSEVVALLSDEERLRELARAYLGMSSEDGQSRESELAKLESMIGTLQDRMSAGIAGFIKAGLDPEAVASAMAQLEDELSALRRRRDAIARLFADEQARSNGLDQLSRMAATASGRLAHADLAMQAEVLALLDVRVTVMDATRTPALRITGTICSLEIAGQGASSAGNPSGQHPRRGWGPASVR